MQQRFHELSFITIVTLIRFFADSEVSTANADVIVAHLQETSEPANKIPGEITHCHDGDTCQVILSSGLTLNVRLAGIDAPEVGRYDKPTAKGQDLGEASRNALVSLVVHKKDTQISQIDLDRYNRPVVEIFVANELINIKMLEIGMAERYTGKTKLIDRTKYEAAEFKSKKCKIIKMI